MVAVEAMAAGTAPVASAHGAFPELVTHGSDGALFPPTDVDALVDILADIDDNPQRWDEYGQQARQTYRSRFSPDAGIDRLLEIYRFAVEHPIERSDRHTETSQDRTVALPSECRRDDDPHGGSKRPNESGKHGLIQAVRRLGWGVADQGISSLSNFALGLFVARSFGASSFGAFTLAFITYTVVINAARGLATDPLLVRYQRRSGRRWRRATSAATGTALAVGVAAGVLCIVAGLLLPDPVGPVFIALGHRAAWACSAGQLAVRVLRLWPRIVRIPQRPVLDRAARPGSRRDCTAGADSAAHCLLAFGGTATLAALLGMVQARTLATPVPRGGMASYAPRTISSVPRRERQHQRCIPIAFLCAGRGGRPCRCRLRSGV